MNTAMIGIYHLCLFVTMAYGEFNPSQYEFIDEELNLEEAESRCNDIDARLFEPKDDETNDQLVNLAKQRIGEKGFWIGIKGDRYLSDDTLLLYSNKKPKIEDDSSNDNNCFCIGCDELGNGGFGVNTDLDFGMWSGKYCTMKKFAAACDKKKVQCNSVALASFQTPDQILTCCTETHKCGDGEGNCDMNVQCEGDLVCGHNNCNNDFPINQLTNMKFSCCYNPEPRCTAKNTAWDCCTTDNKCNENEGDCDHHTDCAGDLLCGTNNCPEGFPDEFDCCTQDPNSGFSGASSCCTRVEVYYDNLPVTMTTFTTIHHYTGEGQNGGKWYGYGNTNHGKYTKQSTINGKWFYQSEFDVLPSIDNWGRMGIWAASDPDYWIIGEDPYRGQANGLAFSSKSDLCIPKDTSNWNFEAGLQNDAQIYAPDKIQGNDIKIRCID